MRMPMRLQKLTASDAAAVGQVRRECYRTARDFDVCNEAELDWSSVDDQSDVYGILNEENGELLSTMRGRVLGALSEMPLTSALMASQLPTLYLSRAATRAECAGLGLNSWLRLHFLESAMHDGCRSVSGVLCERALRGPALSRLGYKVLGEVADGEGLVSRQGRWNFIALDLGQSGARAIEILRAHQGRGADVGSRPSAAGNTRAKIVSSHKFMAARS